MPRFAHFPAPLSAQTLEKTKLTIGVGGKSLFYYLPLTIAERNGYFKAEGLDVEILDFPGGARALQALLGGSVDIVSGAYEHTITQQAKGQMIEALIMQGKYSGIVLGMPKAKAAAYKGPADLKGMKIGVTAPGSSTNMFVNMLLAKAELPPDAAAIIGVGATAGAIAIVKRGEIDAIANLDPVIAQLESDGSIVPVVDTRTAKGMQEVYGGAYAAGSVYVAGRLREEVSEHVAGGRQRDDARAALHPDVHARSDRRRGAARVLHRQGALQGRTREEPRGLQTRRHHRHGCVAERLSRPATFDPRLKGATIDLAKTVNMSFAQKAAQKFR